MGRGVVDCALFVAFAPCSHHGLPNAGTDVAGVPEAFCSMVIYEGLPCEECATYLIDVGLHVFGSRNILLAHTRVFGGRENIANIIFLNNARRRSVILGNSVIFDNALSVIFDNTHVIQDNTLVRDVDESECLKFIADSFGKLPTDIPTFPESRVILFVLIFVAREEVDVSLFCGADGVGAPGGAAEELKNEILHDGGR